MQKNKRKRKIGARKVYGKRSKMILYGRLSRYWPKHLFLY